MNTREYIESGILELYSAGLLSTEEMRDVELKACQYAEIKSELELIQNSLEKYATKHAVTPPSELKKRILKEIEKGGASTEVKTKVIAVQRRSPAMTWLAAASVVLLITVGIIAMRYSAQSMQYQKQVAQLMQKQQTMQSKLDSVKNSLAQNSQQMDLLTDTMTVKVEMKGTKLSPESMAMIYWNKRTQEVYLDIKNLPQAPADKQYQLWFIDPVKGPESAGVFDVATGLLKMINAPAAAAFAVTLEPRGGSATPTLTQMYVIGNVPS